MREIRTSGSMSGDGKRGGLVAPTAPILDSTQVCRFEWGRRKGGALTLP